MPKMRNIVSNMKESMTKKLEMQTGISPKTGKLIEKPEGRKPDSISDEIAKFPKLKKLRKKKIFPEEPLI